MMITATGREFIIKDTHRGLYYEDGKLTKVLETGRYKIPRRTQWLTELPTPSSACWPISENVN